VGLTPQLIKAATRPKEIMIAAIYLNSDPVLRVKLKYIARYHSDYPQVQRVKDDLKAAQPPPANRYNLIKYVLC